MKHFCDNSLLIKEDYLRGVVFFFLAMSDWSCQRQEAKFRLVNQLAVTPILKMQRKCNFFVCIQVKKKCYFASILLGYFVSILLFMKLSCASHLQSNFFVNY